MSTETTMHAIRQHSLGGSEVLELVEVPQAEADADGGSRAHDGGRGQPGRLEGSSARRLSRRAAVHGRLGRRRRRRGDRLRGDEILRRRPRLRNAAISARGRRVRRVRHLAVTPARADPRRLWTTSRRARSHSRGSRRGRRWSRPRTSGRVSASSSSPRQAGSGTWPCRSQRRGVRTCSGRRVRRSTRSCRSSAWTRRSTTPARTSPSARRTSTSCSTSSAARPGSTRFPALRDGGVFVSVPSSAGLDSAPRARRRASPRHGHPRGARSRRSGGTRRARVGRGAPSARLAHVPVGRGRRAPTSWARRAAPRASSFLRSASPPRRARHPGPRRVRRARPRAPPAALGGSLAHVPA